MIQAPPGRPADTPSPSTSPTAASPGAAAFHPQARFPAPLAADAPGHPPRRGLIPGMVPPVVISGGVHGRPCSIETTEKHRTPLSDCCCALWVTPLWGNSHAPLTRRTSQRLDFTKRLQDDPQQISNIKDGYAVPPADARDRHAGDLPGIADSRNWADTSDGWRPLRGRRQLTLPARLGWLRTSRMSAARWRHRLTSPAHRACPTDRRY